MQKMYINGALIEGDGEAFDVCNPATGEIIDQLRAASIEQAEEALQGAQEAYKTWSKTSLNERQEWMQKLKSAYLAQKDSLIELLCAEGGKNPDEAAGEVVGSLPVFFDFFCEEAKRVYGVGVPDYTEPAGISHVVIKRPIGVVVGHMAWNAPVGIFGEMLAPALASGCACVLKPSISTPLSALKIGEIAAGIGFPKGVLNVVAGPSDVIGNYLTSSTIPRLITIVGSTASGLEVMNKGSSSVKRFSLELGGNAPAIIMPDFEMDQICQIVAESKVASCGQFCINFNRVYVHESIHGVFLEKLKAKFENIRIGWGKDMSAHLGPMINTEARDRVLALIGDSVKMGAELIYGGYVPDMPGKLKNGAFIMPTILDKVTDDMPIARNEIFGPVCGIQTFSDFDDALRRANDTEHGLAAYLFTHDSRIMGRFIDGAEAGNVHINFTGMVPHLPHAGNKQSGIGCVRGRWGLEEYYDLRKVTIRW